MSFDQALDLIGPTMEQLGYEKIGLGLVHNHTYWHNCFPDRILRMYQNCGDLGIKKKPLLFL
jgi:hypothetical protein